LRHYPTPQPPRPYIISGNIPIDPEDLLDLEDEEETRTNSQNPSISGSKELRADDPDGEINSNRAKGGGHSNTTT